MDLHKTDPEFMERFEHFAFDEVVNEENQQLDDVTRYMVILATLIGHAKGNMNMGNDKDFLIKIVSQYLPYIGYPRSLNAMNCINKAAED